MKRILTLFTASLSLMLTNGAFSQPRDTTLNRYNGEKNITALNSIKLADGFHLAGGPARIFISEAPQISLSLDHSYNYIVSRKIRVPGVNRNNLYTTKAINEQSLDVLYFDDLGRNIQQIQVAASPSFEDIVQHVEYDSYGRQDKHYLPYAENGRSKGRYLSQAKSQTFSFYQEGSWDTHVSKTSRPFSQTNFENSPLNRLLEQGATGEDWQLGTGHTLKISYGTNVSIGNEAVKRWRVSPLGEGALVSGVYPEGTLLRITRRDENIPIEERKGSVDEYYNFANDIIARRIWTSETAFHGTYYIYDDYDDLRYVLPPPLNEGGKFSNAGINSFGEKDNTYKNYIYSYKFDERRRLVEKKIPARGIQRYVYNALDQLVLSQDSLLAIQNKWNVFKYDVEGREIITGFYNDPARNRLQLQNLLDTATSSIYEVRTSDGLGYSMQTFPKITDVHTVAYYDDYSFPGNRFGSSATQKAGVANVQGLLIGTLRKIIGENKFLLSTYYYDKYGRNVRVVQDNQTGGTEISDKEYDFVGNIVSSTTSTKLSEAHTAIQVKTRYKYDHVGRLQNVYKKIGSGNEIILTRAEYNEIGQLRKKRLHSDDGGRSFLTDIDYAYNPRGWLTRISSPSFTEVLKYQDGTHKQWNGNIANQLWGHSSLANNEFTYLYDSQNRLTEGRSTGIVMSEKISYDELGNVTELIRDNNVNTFSYEGNTLKKISGYLNTQDYRYDGNGNTIFDGRSGFNYSYNHLDLPVEVKHGNSSKLINVYDYSGNLLSKRFAADGIWHEKIYTGGAEYLKIGESTPKLQLIHTEEGVVQDNNGSYSYQYFLSDHLGNVRATIDKYNGKVRVLQRQDYYPYGKLAPVGNIAGTNHYLYNGKEYLPSLGSATSSGQYDYGARYYDPEIVRWGTIDPLAEVTYSSSPYAYVNGNPIFYNDPTGMIANPYIKNILTGEVKWIPDGEDIPLNWKYYASEWFDIQPVVVTATAKKIGSMQAYFDREADVAKREYRKRAPSGLFMGYPTSEINRLTIERIERTWNTNEIVYIPNKYDGGFFRQHTGAGALVDANWVIDLGVGGVIGTLRTFGAKSSLSLIDDVAKGGTPLIQANRTAGNLFRDELAAALRAEGRTVNIEVFKRTPFGKRYMDLDVWHNGVNLGGIETKVGGSRYLPLQKLKDAWLGANGYPVQLVRKPKNW